MFYKRDDPRIVTGRYLAALLSASLHDAAPDEKPEGLPWRDVYRLAAEQEVDCLAFSAAGALVKREDPELYARWKHQNRVRVYTDLMQRQEQEAVLSAFAGRGIPVLVLKGGTIKALYPRPHYRQMHDIDILTAEDRFEEAVDTLTGLGYHLRERQLAEHHDVYVKPPALKLELHRRLMPVGSRYCQGFEDIWQRVQWEKERPCVAHMTPEDAYIYLLAHFANHVRREGENVRILTDIHVMRKAYGDVLDSAYVRREAERLGILELKHEAERLAEMWLSGEPGRSLGPAEEKLEWLLLVSEEDGGFEARVSNEWSRLREKLRHPFRGHLGSYLASVLFPARKNMALDYPSLEKHAWTLPFCWVHRWGRMIAILCRGFGSVRRRNRQKEDAHERGGIPDRTL